MRLVCCVRTKGDRGERTAGVRSGLGIQQGLAGGVEMVLGGSCGGMTGGCAGKQSKPLIRVASASTSQVRGWLLSVTGGRDAVKFQETGRIGGHNLHGNFDG